VDAALLHGLNRLLAGPTRPLWEALASPVSPWVLGLALLAWCAWKRAWRMLLVLAVSVALADVVSVRVVKPLVARPRPCHTEVVHLVGDCGSGASMPSTHASNTAAIALASGSPALALLAVLAGTSRVVVGQHWPSDVGVGWLLGAGIGAGVRAAARKALGWT
jgi:undecaprenyl-diphosphatase